MKKILVVDDEPVIIELVKGFLLNEYEIYAATDGKEALEKVETMSPDLVLLDVIMPKINGYEVCRKLKSGAKTKFIPIVMVTSLTEKENRIKAIEAGVDDFLNKPLDKLELNARVKSLLRIKQYHDDLEEIKNRFIELYDFAPVGYFTLTSDGRIREANLTGTVILGGTRQDMINCEFRHFVVPRDLEKWDHHLSNALKNWDEQNCELTLKREGGSMLLVRLSSFRMEAMDGKPEVRTAMTDITHHEQKEKTQEPPG